MFLNELPVERIEAADVSNVVAFLPSDEAHYVTGLEVKITPATQSADSNAVRDSSEAR